MSVSPADQSYGSLPPGTVLGHYEIVAPIGAGGMGVVYRAVDTRLRREVALKVLPADTAADPERRQRFEREARAVASLNHPHIVTIHSVEEAGGQIFLTMELMGGQPLTDLIPRGGMSLEPLLKIGVQIADAVSAAHARGITHRDLKPANVMLTSDGVAKVLDFGLAKLTDASAVSDRQVTGAPDVITGEGRVLGTVAYMAPEQAEGKPVDARSDIFSLGVMLYEMATGERPFKGDTSLSTLTAIMRDTPKPVTEVNPAVPKELGRVIRRALAKDPDRRQQTGKDLRNELDEIRQELESGELTSGTAHAAVSASPRRSRGVALAGAAAALVVLGAAGWMALRPAAAPTRGEAPAAISVTSLTAEGGTENFPSLSPDGKWLIYAGEELASGQTDILLRAVGGQSVINLTKDSPVNDTQPAFSRDGDRIVFRSERDGGGLFVMGRTGESVRRLTSEGFNPSWSPDGTSVAYATEPVGMSPTNRQSASRLWIVMTATGERRQLTHSDAVQPVWSPHGSRVAYWGLAGESSQRDLWTVDVKGGESVGVTSDIALDWSPVWSPDGRFLYFSSDRSGPLNLWRIGIDEATGRPAGDPEAMTLPRQDLGQFSFSADGTLLAFVNSLTVSNIEALTFDPERGVVGGRRRVTDGSDTPTAPSVSPDGQWLAFYRLTNGQEDIWAVRTDGTAARQLTNDAARDRRPVWSPDGKRLLFYSDRTVTYQAWLIDRDGGALTQLTNLPRLLIEPSWSPDGTKAIANLNREAKALLFDPRVPAAQQKTEELPARDGGGFRASSWSPDGQRIAGFANRPDGGIVLYGLASRTYEQITETGRGPVWLPDSRRLLYVVDRTLWLVDSVTREAKQVFSAGREAVGPPGLAPGAREIYTVITNPQSDIGLAKLPAPR